MPKTDPRNQEMEALRDRLSRLSEASLRINESLDLDTVLQGVLDSARSLTDARYGVLTTLDQSGQLEEFLTSGLTPEESGEMSGAPKGLEVFEFLANLPGPLRVEDFRSYARSVGLPEMMVPAAASSFLAVPILHRGARMGNIFFAKEKAGHGFRREDEEILVMFASQAALVIANARRYQDERRARADLDALINTSPVGVILFDARTGVPVSFNREAARLVEACRPPGQSQSLEQLQEVLTFRRPDGVETALKEFPLAQALKVGETVRVEEIVLRVPGGRAVSALVNASPITSEDGEVESVVVTLQDMTPMEDLERLRAEFLGMVSHELRLPLASIRGSATALLDSHSDLDLAEMRQFFRIIVEQSDNMREMIGNLLDVARIKTGTLPVEPEPLEVASLLDQARDTFLSGGGLNNLDIALGADLPLVMADRRRLAQVLGNLLSNAARHSPESSVIRVTAVWEEPHVAVSVVDEGWGISAERLPHLFTRFSPAGVEEQGRKIGGSNLGLSICKGIVEAHGGRIWAESDGPGLGARFTFTIPVVAKAARLPRGSRQTSRQEGKDRERILVVDDDPQVLGYVRETLYDEDYDSIVTSDPGEVPLLVRENKPHLVLIDMMLPGTDGIELMKEILDVADLPVIFLAGYGRDEAILRAFESGAADYIVKPFSPTELVGRVRAALRKRVTAVWSEPAEPYVLGDLTVDYVQRRVTVAGRAVHLTASEYELLYELSVNAGRVVPHHQLLRKIWGPAHSADVRGIRTLMRRLRHKLDDDAKNPTYFFAERRVGYRMPKGRKPGQVSD